MEEEDIGRTAQLEPAEGALLAAVAESHADGPEKNDLLDDGRSSSLSDLEDGPEELDMISADSGFSRPPDADSEAETERLENSPDKSRKQKYAPLGAAAYSQSKTNFAQSIAAQAPKKEAFSDSGVSSPAATEEDVDSEVRSERAAASDDEDARDVRLQSGSPRKRKHFDLDDHSGGEEEVEEARRRRRRTESVRSDVEDQSDLGMSREHTAEPMADITDDQAALEGTPNVFLTGNGPLNPIPKAATRGKISKTNDHEGLEDIAEAHENPDHTTNDDTHHAPIESDDEDPGEGEEEDLEAAARNEEECEISGVDTQGHADRFIDAKKMAAMDSLAALEKHFAALRDR
jgi:hypothetical protein